MKKYTRLVDSFVYVDPIPMILTIWDVTSMNFLKISICICFIANMSYIYGADQ